MSEPESEITDTAAVAPEVTPTQPETKSNRRDADDLVLDRLMGSGDEESSAHDEPAVAPPSVDRQRYASVLKRDGVPEEVIASVSEDTLKAWVAKAEKRQKDVDGYGKKMADLEKQVKSNTKQETRASDEDLEDDVELDIEPDSNDSKTASAEDPFVEVEELLGEEATKPLKAMRAELAELRQRQAAAAEQSLMAQVDAADAYFRSRYGDSSPTREAVVAEMNRLGSANPGTYTTVMHLAEEAFISLTGQRGARSDQRTNGQPTAVKSVSRSERPRNTVDAEDAILDALLSGKTRDEAMRLIRK
jgi:hypothetical protein